MNKLILFLLLFPVLILSDSTDKTKITFKLTITYDNVTLNEASDIEDRLKKLLEDEKCSIEIDVNPKPEIFQGWQWGTLNTQLIYDDLLWYDDSIKVEN